MWLALVQTTFSLPARVCHRGLITRTFTNLTYFHAIVDLLVGRTIQQGTVITYPLFRENLHFLYNTLESLCCKTRLKGGGGGGREGGGGGKGETHRWSVDMREATRLASGKITESRVVERHGRHRYSAFRRRRFTTRLHATRLTHARALAYTYTQRYTRSIVRVYIVTSCARTSAVQFV